MMAPEARYETLLKLAAGGMATVYVGTVRGALGFRQLVAIKKPHPHLLADPEYKRELIAEARLASMIHHANVVDVRDVEVIGDSVSLVMDYIEGASLGDLLVAASKGGPKVTPGVAVRIVLDALAGLHAAHELTDERGRPVGLVHRDISPQNILVGTDGVSRVTDFGVAKFARKGGPSTTEGSLKGKLAYMAPEYLRGETIDRAFDVFAMGVVLWEALTGKRLFRGEHEADTLQKVLYQPAPAVSTIAPEMAALDPVIEAALSKDRASRFTNAAAMAAALEQAARSAGMVAGYTDVAALVRAAAGADLEERRSLLRLRLAKEPSVASLFTGVTAPELPSTEPAPAPPPTQAAPTIVAPPPITTLEVPAAPQPPVAASTLRSEGSGPRLAAAPVASTLPSPVQAPEAIGSDPGFTVEPSLRAYGVTDVIEPRLPPKRGWIFVASALLLAAAAGTTLYFFKIRTAPPSTAASTATSTASATASSTSTASSTPTSTPTSTARPSTPTPTTKPTARPPATAKAPTPKPTGSSGPPPNPYAN
jgi:serine/threonine-protein kinase